MSKKTSKITDNITQHPAKWAVLFIALWTVAVNGLFLLTNFVFANALMLMISFMVIYPLFTLVICFIYAKNCGIRWFMPFPIIVITVAEYIFLENFRAIVPDILVVTGFCLLFGSGIGNIFVDKAFIDKQKKQRRDKKLHEDKKYKKILDD